MHLAFSKFDSHALISYGFSIIVSVLGLTKKESASRVHWVQLRSFEPTSWVGLEVMVWLIGGDTPILESTFISCFVCQFFLKARLIFIRIFIFIQCFKKKMVACVRKKNSGAPK